MSSTAPDATATATAVMPPPPIGGGAQPQPAPARPTVAAVVAGSASPTAAKAIPRARPAPIAMAARGSLGASPGGSSLRRGITGRSVSDANGDNDWRARGTSLGTSVSDRLGDSLPKSRGPERTVGGFEKREVRAGGGQSALSSSKGAGEVKSSALAHVPCRFFKAGACTAGSSCQFSHEVGAKKEVCQWFLKGDCKFGHKCALAHVRPGEPMSMDRRNKKEQQREARERADKTRDDLGTSPAVSTGGLSAGMPIPSKEGGSSTPVPIKSAISASLGGSLRSSFASSPMREPYGPPAAVGAGSPSAGFNHRGSVTTGAFGASPSRPSPLSSSFNRGGTSLRTGSSLVNSHSPLRPPNAPAFSSSFSHTSMAADKPQLSASFAGKSIWARSETPDEPLSPARRPIQPPVTVIDDVFDEDDAHGEDLIPSSLTDLLTPTERARRMSRTDSRDSYVGSPGRFANPHQFVGAERLAQSANAALPGGFLQALWSQDGKDAREAGDIMPGSPSSTAAIVGSPSASELQFKQSQPPPPLRQSLLSQSRQGSGSSPTQTTQTTLRPAVDAPYLVRDTDPSSPSARALQEHAPGQSLPGGIAAALSRMHMQPGRSALATGVSATPASSGVPTPPIIARTDHDEDELFHMDG